MYPLSFPTDPITSPLGKLPMLIFLPIDQLPHGTRRIKKVFNARNNGQELFGKRDGSAKWHIFQFLIFIIHAFLFVSYAFVVFTIVNKAIKWIY